MEASWALSVAVSSAAVALAKLAGAEGFEPPSPVLETGSLTVELTPLFLALRDSLLADFTFLISEQRKASSVLSLLRLFVRRVLPALPAEFVKLQPARRGLLILGSGVVAVFALSTLQRHNLAGHLTFLDVYSAARTAKPCPPLRRKSARSPWRPAEKN